MSLWLLVGLDVGSTWSSKSWPSRRVSIWHYHVLIKLDRFCRVSNSAERPCWCQLQEILQQFVMVAPWCVWGRSNSTPQWTSLLGLNNRHSLLSGWSDARKSFGVNPDVVAHRLLESSMHPLSRRSHNILMRSPVLCQSPFFPTVVRQLPPDFGWLTIHH